MKTLAHETLNQLSQAASQSPRLRSNSNLHPSLESGVQRLAIAMEPDTYVRPHRHNHSFELLTVLKGSFEVIIFDKECKTISQRIQLNHQHTSVLEMPAGTWHSVISCEPGSVVFEVKEGAYQPVTPSDTAEWSPVEGEATVPHMLQFLRTGQPGQSYTA